MRLRMRAALASLTVALALVPLVATGAVGDSIEMVTPQEAARDLAATDPTSVDDTPLEGESTVPSVEPTADGFTVEGGAHDVALGAEATDAIELATDSGQLSLSPQGVSSAASAGTPIGDTAVVYANTGEDADTAIKPTEKGVETFTNIRSDDAAEDFSWEVALPGDEALVKLADGKVAVVDPTPTLPADEDLPQPRAPESAGAEAAREASGSTTPDPNPAALAEATEAAGKAGTERPPDVAGIGIEPIDVSPAEANAGLERAPTTTLAENEQPSATTLALRRDAIDAAVQTEAAVVAAQSSEAGADMARESNAHNQDESEDSPVVIATLEAPESLDADGKQVPTELRVDGDLVTMHVDHHNADIAYPIAADPIIQVVVVKYRLAWYPTFRSETYVSHWAQANAYVGSWHPVYCSWGMQCAAAGGSWWGVNHAGASYAAYWPSWNWGPVWQPYWYPVYATRMVVDMWVPYWQPYQDIASYDTDRLSLFDDGGETQLEYDAAYDDDGSLEPFSFAAAQVHKSPNCRRVRRHSHVSDAVLGDMGFVAFKTKYCWSRKRRKTSYAADSSSIDPRLKKVAEVIGLEIREGGGSDDRFPWRDGNGVRITKDFDLRACTPVIHIGCVTAERYQFVVRGYWDGTMPP